MSPTVSACVLVVCLILGINAQPTPPPPAPPGSSCEFPPYDVDTLAGQEYWAASVPTVINNISICFDANATECTFYIAFCRQVEVPRVHGPPIDHGCHGAAICQVGHDARGRVFSHSMGKFTEDNFQFHPISATAKGGFSMEVYNGTKNDVDSDCKTYGISSLVKLVCNESAVWTNVNQNVTNFTTVQYSPERCKYTITIQYSGACSHMATPTPTRSSSSATKGHMTHTSTRNFTTTHSPHNMTSTSKHTTVNMTTHSMPSTAEHSSTKHTGSSTTSNHISPTKSSSPTRTHSSSSHPKPTATPTNRPPTTTHPPHHTTPGEHTTHPHTKPHTTKPTENPLQHKVTGLTAGVVIFALVAFFLVVLFVGLVYFIYKRGGGFRYRMVSNINDE